MKKYLPLLAALSISAEAGAQVVAGSSFFGEIVSDWHSGFTADFTGACATPSDIRKDGDGKLGVYEATGLVKYQGANKHHAIDASVGYRRSLYDFDGESPFSDVNRIFATYFHSVNIDEKWSAFALCLGSFTAESAASLSDGGRILAGAGVGYKVNENIRFGLGAGAVSRLENDWLPVPVCYLDWKINEHLSLRTFAGAALIYDVFADGTLLLNFSCEYQNTAIRLTDSNAGLGRSVSDSFVQCAVGATYNITKSMYVSGTIGGNFSRTLVFRQNGASGREFDIDSAPVFYLHIGYKL